MFRHFDGLNDANILILYMFLARQAKHTGCINKDKIIFLSLLNFVCAELSTYISKQTNLKSEDRSSE